MWEDGIEMLCPGQDTTMASLPWVPTFTTATPSVDSWGKQALPQGACDRSHQPQMGRARTTSSCETHQMPSLLRPRNVSQ